MKQGSKEISIEAKFLAKRRAWARKPEILRTLHRIYLGDARAMTQLGSNQPVHLVVTSPPYWNLKEYPFQEDVQLGNFGDYRRFVGELTDRKSTRLNSSHIQKSRMPSSA